MRCELCHRPVPAGLPACPEDGGVALDSVAGKLRAGPIPLSQAVKLAGRVLDQLGAMHAARRHHGALGPAAVLFRHKGDELRVVVWAPQEAAPAPYVAPEGRGGPAADVFAVGVLLHHMITGRLPPEGGRLPSLAEHSLQDVPEALDALLAELSDPDPARRPSPIPAVQARLENLELDSTLSGARLAALREVGAEPAPPRRVVFSPPGAPDADPSDETFIRSRAELEARARSVESSQPSDPFADTVIGRREALEAEGEQTLASLPAPSGSDDGESLEASTELLSSRPGLEPSGPPALAGEGGPGRWLLLSLGLGLGLCLAALVLFVVR